MAFRPSTRELLRALNRGETVEHSGVAAWYTSGGERASQKDVHILIAAGLAEYCDWRFLPSGAEVGVKARLKRREARRPASSSEIQSR
jgi:hypothetical protein